MQANIIPEHPCFGSKSPGDAAKTNSCCSFGEKGFLHFWMRCHPGAEDQEECMEAPGFLGEAEEQENPVGEKTPWVLGAPLGLQVLVSGEEGPPGFNPEILHGLAQKAAEKEGGSNASLLARELAETLQILKSRGEEVPVTGSIDKVDLSGEQGINSGISGKKEAKPGMGVSIPGEVNSGILVDPETGGDEISFPSAGGKEGTGTEDASEKEVFPGEGKGSGRLSREKAETAEDVIRSIPGGQGKENRNKAAEKTPFGLNQAEESPGFTRTAEPQRYIRTSDFPGLSGDMKKLFETPGQRFFSGEAAEGKETLPWERGEPGKAAFGMSRAEGISLMPGTLPESSQSAVSQVSQGNPQGVPVKGEDLVFQLVQKLEVVQHLERSEMKIQLKPEHLGEVTITLVKENDQVRARLVAESLQVKEALQSGLSQLRERLESQNVKVVEFHVEVSKQDSGFPSGGGFQSGFHFSGDPERPGASAGIPGDEESSGEYGKPGNPKGHTDRVDCLV